MKEVGIDADMAGAADRRGQFQCLAERPHLRHRIEFHRDAEPEPLRQIAEGAKAVETALGIAVVGEDIDERCSEFGGTAERDVKSRDLGSAGKREWIGKIERHAEIIHPPPEIPSARRIAVEIEARHVREHVHRLHEQADAATIRGRGRLGERLGIRVDRGDMIERQAPHFSSPPPMCGDALARQ